MLLFRYLLDRRRVIIACLLLAAGAWGLFWLYGLPEEPLSYCFLLLTAGGCGLFAVPDFVAYRRRLRRAKALHRTAPRLTQPVETAQPGQDLHSRLLLETIEELRQYNVELERQLDNRQEELLEYFTLWAHQIKTPLAAMRLLLQSGGQKDETAGAMRQELFQTERYVDLVLGYLRIYSMNADLKLGQYPVRPIAARAAKKFAVQFIYKGLRLELPEFQNQVVTDEKWLEFVLEQLISNAVKYSPAGTVTISMDEHDVLTVRDQGAGIDPADLPRIFERGFTGHNGRRSGRENGYRDGQTQEASTGLGLYLTRRVMDKLGSRIEVCSALGEGTQVRLYLGRAPAPKD